jgi:MSHA biogenesis protein MshO
MHPRQVIRGVTLVELVVTILLMGIVGAAFAMFLGPAVRGYVAQTQRAALVDAAESALRRVARDIRVALPNSVRITATASGFALELVPSVDGGRYCAATLADCSGAAQLLDFSANDTDFDLLGCFRNSAFLGSTFPTAAYRLVIGNTGNEVYSDTGSPAVITPTTTSLTLSVVPAGTCGSGLSRHHLSLSASHRFSTQSPRERVFLVRTSEAPVSYVCDATAQTLTRYAGYSFQAGAPANISAASSVALVASSVSDCGLSAMSSTANVQNTGIVTLRLGLTNAAETVTLLHQAQLDNSQ